MENLIDSNPWLQLPETFYRRVDPTPLAEPYFVAVNAAAGLHRSRLTGEAALRCFNGEHFPPGVQALATVYAGHQFGIYTSELGDGRALTLGATVAANGESYEIQLKGAGLTPYSRTLDGRCPLSSAVREYLGAEALHALGIPTARGIALVSGSTRIRRDRHEHNAAILVRSARSFLRFGHFEYFHHRDDFESLTPLLDFAVECCTPELLNEAPEIRPLRFLEIMTERTAHLVALWQSAGFAHGVMNTDNMTVGGETLDLGPFGFMETYDPGFTPNPADDQNRYAYDQQPDIGRWNCLALAEALSSLLPGRKVPAGLLRHYRQSYRQHYLTQMRSKLGLMYGHESDGELINALLSKLAQTGCDYPLFFRNLADIPERRDRTLFHPLLHDWLERYRQRLYLEATSAEQRKRLQSDLRRAASFIGASGRSRGATRFCRTRDVVVAAAKPIRTTARIRRLCAAGGGNGTETDKRLTPARIFHIETPTMKLRIEK
ncbi:MAG: protein adenylyltransferase SelO family protein, partial [Gammaproteobacteria bacterium]